MDKCLIIRGNDAHTYRLEQSLSMCKVDYKTVTEYGDIPTDKVDFAFVDPSVSFDPTSRLNAETISFYDTEDSPTDFESGPAYESLKDEVSHYVKMTWLDEDDRGDGIKNIGFPPGVHLMLSQLAKVETTAFSHENAVPLFIGAGTFLGRYSTQNPDAFNCDEKLDIKSLAKDDDGNWMYNQRIDWLLSLRKNNIPHIGGLVFKEHNVSKEWQSKYFGKGVPNLEYPQTPYGDLLNALLNCRVALCPTGHERISWRTFDIMAAGAILIHTDLKGQKSFYMPKESVTIEDGEDLGTTLLSLQPQYKELWKAAQENRRVYLNMTPESIWTDFTNQYK